MYRRCHLPSSFLPPEIRPITAWSQKTKVIAYCKSKLERLDNLTVGVCGNAK